MDKKYTKFFEDLDITILEINDSYEKDLIKEIEFLDYDSNYVKGYNQYKDIDIFTLQFPRDDIEVASGKVKEIYNDFEFKHNIDTEYGASGSPIILPVILKVIGIHKWGEKYENFNYGTFIGEIFKNNRLNEKGNKKENINDKRNKIENKNFKINEKESLSEMFHNVQDKIDIKLYSRQLSVLGMETMKKIIKMKILIIGLRGLGVEIAKNIILIGPNEVQIYDPEIVKINDLGSNFFLNEADVGQKRRDEASISQLSELNPYVKVLVMKGNLIDNLKQFNAVVITEMMSKEKLLLINEICHKNKIGFIYTSLLVLSGFVFNDFGPEHIILDDNGEECKSYFIKSITNNGMFIIHRYTNHDRYDYRGNFRLNLGDNDYVIFKEVGGISQLNDGRPRKIKIISSDKFQILGDDFSKYPEYTSGGIVNQVKIPKKMCHKTLRDIFDKFNDEKPIEAIDSSKLGRNELLFITFFTLHEYYSKYNSLPKLNNKKQMDEIVKRTEELYKKNYKLCKEGKIPWFAGVQDWDEKIPKQVASWSRAEISPLCSFLGGVVSLEIIKLTGKYIPINQWLVFDFFEAIEN